MQRSLIQKNITQRNLQPNKLNTNLIWKQHDENNASMGSVYQTKEWLEPQTCRKPSRK